MLPYVLLLPAGSVGSHAVFDLQLVCAASPVTRQNSVLRLPGKIGDWHPNTPGPTVRHTLQTQRCVSQDAMLKVQAEVMCTETIFVFWFGCCDLGQSSC